MKETRCYELPNLPSPFEIALMVHEIWSLWWDNVNSDSIGEGAFRSMTVWNAYQIYKEDSYQKVFFLLENRISLLLFKIIV